ncbi:methyl-CpG-binding domain protein 1b isoform X2 [Brienomyrus brachyistius]|uniref:methyl-CpG-binding domain protein 1b isoform X2 n=1 Tax=Brienomyrus brachyistius TaxID=42636 RepID=UPI0020B2676D|nr:methyl-CpG-binding domain protein 1b isoform X2 [Brienomyrus brachyistius]
MSKEAQSNSDPDSQRGDRNKDGAGEVETWSKGTKGLVLSDGAERPLASAVDGDAVGKGEERVGSEMEAQDKMDEPPGDWLEPLEEDDDDDDGIGDNRQSWQLGLLPGAACHNGKGDVEVGSLAGESERSGSLADSERNFMRKRRSNGKSRHRRKKSIVDDEWEDWPILGRGWKRKEVFRRSGFTVGRTDTYYMSPSGDRLRSKIEMIRHLAGAMDLSSFDFKSGLFLDRVVKCVRKRGRPKKDRSPSTGGGNSSERSVSSERGGHPDHSYTSDMPLALPRAAPGSPLPLSRSQQESAASLPTRRPAGILPVGFRICPVVWSEPDPSLAPLSLPSTPEGDGELSSGSPSSSVGPGLFADVPGNTASSCSRCGDLLTGGDGPPLQPGTCHKCRSEKKPVDSRSIIFRKWLPCGQCRACLVTEDCGNCANCRNGLLYPDFRKPIRCRHRKCLCPIRKSLEAPMVDDYTGASASRQTVSEYTGSEEFFLLDDDDDLEGGPKRRSRRACGMCSACLHTSDCGTCDFCIDKPKFGGSNKKRQKCRLRQCQRQAMRHLLPFQMDGLEFPPAEGWSEAGRPRPSYKYPACSSSMRKSSVFMDEPWGTDEEEDSNEAFRLERYGLETMDGDSVTSLLYQVNPTNGQKEGSVSFCQLPIQTDGGAKSSRSEGRTENGLTDKLPDGGYSPAALPLRTAAGPPALCTVPVRMPEGQVARGSAGPDEGAGLQEVVSPVNALELTPKVRSCRQATDGLPESLAPCPLALTPLQITQIFSLAGPIQPGPECLSPDRELRQLLAKLHESVLPIHWVALMTEGPQLQLVQCSKLSAMADTVLHIELGLGYQLSVQGQPLLPTHPVYDGRPARMASVADVVSLLLDLEELAVCLGFPLSGMLPCPGPSPCERAATCDFLVPQNTERCRKCAAVAPVQ